LAQPTFRLELWNRTNTAREAVFARVLKLDHRFVLKGESTLVASVPFSDPAVPSVAGGKILRVQEEGTVEFSLWRILGLDQQRTNEDETFLTIQADALWMDLRHGKIRQEQSDGRSLFQFGLQGIAPEDLVADYVVPGYEGDAIDFQLGAVDPAIAASISLAFDDTSPLAAIRMIEEAGLCEIFFRLDTSGTFYHIDLLERIGTAAGGATLRYEKNMLGLSKRRDETDIETRVFARGAGALTLADAEWKVAANAAGVLTFTGKHPVFEDGAFAPNAGAGIAGLWFYIPGKGAYPITASAATAGTLTINPAALPAIVAGDIGWIAKTVGGTRLDYLESPSARIASGVRVGNYEASDIPDAENQLLNGDFSAWSGGMPTNWTKVGPTLPTVTQITDLKYIQHGTAAARVQAVVAEAGIKSATFPSKSTTTRPYTGFAVGMTVITGTVRVELRDSTGKVYPIDRRPQNDGRGVYITLKAGPAHADPLPADDYELWIVSHGGAADFYVDSAMVTPQIGSDVPEFVLTSGAHLLWDNTALELAERQKPKIEYSIDVADLYLIDSTKFVFDRIELGDDVTIWDPAIESGSAIQRVVELGFDPLDPADTHVALAPSVRERIPDPHRPLLPSITGTRGTGGFKPRASKPYPYIIDHFPIWDPLTELLAIQVVANARTASIDLYTKATKAGSYPPTPTATLNDRIGTFSGLAVPAETALFYKLVPKDGTGAPGEEAEGAYDRSQASANRATVYNFREIRRTEDSVTFGWEWGPLVHSLWIYLNAVDNPPPTDPWPDTTQLPYEIIYATELAEITVPIPPQDKLIFMQAEPRGDPAGGFTVGPVKRLIINPTHEPPDRIVIFEALVNDEDGSVTVKVFAVDRTKSYRYAFLVGTNPAWPTDTDVQTGTLRPITGNDAFILPAGTVGWDEIIRIRAAPYKNDDGTGDDGTSDHGEIVGAEDIRLKPPVALELTYELETATDATAGITVVDDGGVATQLYTRTRTGTAAPSAWVPLGPAPPINGTEYQNTVALQEDHPAEIEFRLDYVFNGSILSVHYVAGPYDKGKIPNGQVVPVLNEANDSASANLLGDSDSGSWKIAASTAGMPSDATARAAPVINGRTVPASTVGTLISGITAGQRVYYKAFIYSGAGGTGNESSAAVTAEAVYTSVAPILEDTHRAETATDGESGVTVRDPSAKATGLYYRKRTGGNAWPAGWTLKTATPADNTQYLETVPLDEKHPSQIQWRLTYTIVGDAQEFTVYSPVFDKGRIPDGSLIGNVSETGGVDANGQGDFDTASWKIAAARGAYPSDATVRAATAINGRNVIATNLLSPALNPGERAYIKGFLYSGAGGTGTESSAAVTTTVDRGNANRPKEQIDVVRSGTIATVTMTLRDEQLKVTALEYNERVGDGAASGWTAWTGGTGTIGVSKDLVRSRSVSVPDGKDSEFRYRFTFTDELGISRPIEGTVPLPNLQAASKTIVVPCHAFVPEIASSVEMRFTDDLGWPSSTTASKHYATVLLPKGITITAFTARLRKGTGTDSTAASFRKSSRTTTGSITTISTITASSNGDVIYSNGTSELVGDDMYTIRVDFDPDTITTNCGVFWCEFSYTSPSATKNTY
jgi:hypothetical protein